MFFGFAGTAMGHSRKDKELKAFALNSLGAERARFELAEEREPLAGLANRCLGPLDYLSHSIEFYS